MCHVPEHLPGKKGLVPLEVDDEGLGVQPQYTGGFRHTVAPRGMVTSGHDRLAAEALHAVPDATIVGGHADTGQSGHLPGLLIHPLNQGFAQNKRQGLAGKAGGAVAGRDEHPWSIHRLSFFNQHYRRIGRR